MSVLGSLKYMSEEQTSMHGVGARLMGGWRITITLMFIITG